MREIKLLELNSGKCPFERWYKSIGDQVARRRIAAAVTRLADSSFRSFKGVGQGVQELKIFYGPGYRVYFGFRTDTLVILLGGSDKNSQRDNIDEAKTLWKEYKDEPSRYQRKLVS